MYNTFFFISLHFINTYDIYYNLLYISIDVLIHSYISYSMSKNTLKTPIH
jgi:hypothetical protein